MSHIGEEVPYLEPALHPLAFLPTAGWASFTRRGGNVDALVYCYCRVEDGRLVAVQGPRSKAQPDALRLTSAWRQQQGRILDGHGASRLLRVALCPLCASRPSMDALCVSLRHSTHLQSPKAPLTSSDKEPGGRQSMPGDARRCEATRDEWYSRPGSTIDATADTGTGIHGVCILSKAGWSTRLVSESRSGQWHEFHGLSTAPSSGSAVTMGNSWERPTDGLETMEECCGDLPMDGLLSGILFQQLLPADLLDPQLVELCASAFAW